MGVVLFKLGEASQWPSRWARLSVDCAVVCVLSHVAKRGRGDCWLDHVCLLGGTANRCNTEKSGRYELGTRVPSLL